MLKRNLSYTLSFLFAIIVLSLGYFVPRSNFYLTIGLFTTLFILALVLAKQMSFYNLLVLGFVSRFTLLFSFPELSDDFYRFVWDGLLTIKGINPYTYVPADIVHIHPLLEQIYPKLNSPNYYSVYPAFNQYIYAVSVFLGAESLRGSVIVMKLLMLLSEIGSAYFLIRLFKKYQLHEKWALFYILNPVVILEFCDNLHFEGFMLTALLASFYFLGQKKIIYAGASLSVAICLKLMPLLFIPFYWKYLGLKKGLIFTLITISISIVLFLPFEVWKVGAYQNILESIQLYFSLFEFNSSLYRLWVFFDFVGLKLYLIMILIFLIFKQKSKDFISLVSTVGWVQFVYFVFSQSVHPWYVLPILPLLLFTKDITVVIWSFLILLTYNTYQTEVYEQSDVLIFVEYALLCLAFVFRERITRLFIADINPE